MLTRSGSAGPAEDDERTFLYLAVGLVIAMVAAGVLAFLVWRSAGETFGAMAVLGLPLPGSARPTAATAPAAPPPVALPTPVPALTPVRAADTAWYFADGGTTGTVTTTYVLLNASDATVTGTASFLPDSGAASAVPFTIRPQSRLSVPAPGRGTLAARFLGSSAFYAGRVSAGGSDAVTEGAVTPSTTWYLPNVESRLGYDDVLSLANLDSATASVRVTLMADNGITQTLTYTVPAMGRVSTFLTRALAPLSSVRPGTPRGAVVQSDRPVVAGQAVQVEGGGSYALAGAASLSKTWYVAEANTRGGFSTTLAILNPGPAAAKVMVTYLPEGRPPLIKTYALPPYSPLRLNVNGEIADAALGVVIEADQPVAAARITYLSGGQGAHATLAAPAAATDWFLPESSAAAPATAFLVILNPGTAAAEATVTFLPEEGRPTERKVSIAAGSRLALALDRDVPPTAMGARVRATQPVVVEQVTYYRGTPGGTASMGVGR